jgi:replicative DNA helicase
MTDSAPIRPYPATALAGDLIKHLRHVRARVQAGKTPGVPTGIPSIDKHLGGLQTGVILLAASPGAGKTSLALQIARRAAAADTATVYLAFDESGDRLALKLAAAQGGLSATSFLKGEADPDDIERAMEKHHDLLSRIRVLGGTAAVSVTDVMAMVRESMEISGCDDGLVIVDFLQSWAAGLDASGDFRMAVSTMMGELRAAAAKHRVPVLAITAQNRSGQGQASLASLRESSDAEYVADSVLFLTSEDMELREPRRRVTLTCLKNRWGPLFDADLIFDAERGTFSEGRRQ